MWVGGAGGEREKGERERDYLLVIQPELLYL